MASFEKINYILRPRKQIERKILIEILGKIDEINKYRYVGMGSTHFYDFILLHKALGISDMISLERSRNSQRAKFNKPYDFIKVEDMNSTEFLERRAPQAKTILWLDYDSPLFRHGEPSSLNSEILSDIEIVTSKAKAPTFLVISTQVNELRTLAKQKHFIDLAGSYLPYGFKSEQRLKSDPSQFDSEFPLLAQQVLLNVITEHQKYRDVKFIKLFSFVYEDGARMLSVGGVFDAEEKCDHYYNLFSEDDYVATGNDEIQAIDVPILTYKEKAYLDSQIRKIAKEIEDLGPEEVDKYMTKLAFKLANNRELCDYLRFYRYYPQYYEALI